MIVKMTLVSTNTAPELRPNDSEWLGYSSAYPEPGHPMIVWYAKNGESRYLRTSSVKSVKEQDKTDDGRSVFIVETAHSVYRVETLAIQFETEKESFSAAVNGRIKES